MQEIRHFSDCVSPSPELCRKNPSVVGSWVARPKSHKEKEALCVGSMPVVHAQSTLVDSVPQHAQLILHLRRYWVVHRNPNPKKCCLQ